MMFLLLFLILSSFIVIINNERDISLKLQKKHMQLKPTIVALSSKIRQKGRIEKEYSQEKLGLSSTFTFDKKIYTNYIDNENYRPIDSIYFYFDQTNTCNYKYILNSKFEVYINNIPITKEMIEIYSNFLSSNFKYKINKKNLLNYQSTFFDTWPCYEAKIIYNEDAKNPEDKYVTYLI